MNWYLQALRQYATFHGRARRKEYWMFSLFYTIILYASIGLDFLMGINFYPVFIGPFYLVIAIGHFIPTLAVTVRRLHDIGKSGWWMLICLIPIVGVIWFLILLVSEGDLMDNQYGPNPKGINL